MDGFRRFMYGRSGFDALVGACLGGAVLCTALSRLMPVWLLRWLLSTAGYLFMAAAIYRFTSRDLAGRQRENEKFLELFHRKKTIKGTFREKEAGSCGKKKEETQTGAYRYFSCPSCGSSLRVPEGKGKIRITCPRCKKEFEQRT